MMEVVTIRGPLSLACLPFARAKMRRLRARQRMGWRDSFPPLRGRRYPASAAMTSLNGRRVEGRPTMSSCPGALAESTEVSLGLQLHMDNVQG